MNEVFARQFDYVISLSTLDEIERWKFYIKCRFDHVDKKKHSLTDNNSMGLCNFYTKIIGLL